MPDEKRESRPGAGWAERLLDRLQKPRALLVLQVVVAALLVVGLLSLVDLEALGHTLGAIEAWSLLAAVGFLVATLLLGAFDVWVLLRAIAPLRYGTVLRVYVIAWSSFLALPGSAGDAVQILLFKRADIEYREGTSVYLTDKLITLAVNLAVVAVGGALLFPGRVRPWILAAVAGAAAAIALGGYLAARQWLAPEGSLADRLLDVVEYAAGYARRYPLRIGLNCGGTVVRLAAAAAASWVLFRGLGTEIAPSTVMVLHLAAGLVAYVPIAFNGIGTVEATAVGLYGLFGVGAADTVAMYVVLRSLVFATVVAALAATVWRRP